MDDFLKDLLNVQKLVDQSPAIKLLRAQQLPLITIFLYQTFKADDLLSVPFQEVHNQLTSFLEEIDYQEDAIQLDSQSLFIDYDEKAKTLLNKWIDGNYLRNVIDEERKEPVLLLSQHVEKVFRVLEMLQERSFVGTESKFMDIFYKMQDIVENANPDKEKRLEELHNKQQAIQAEIEQIQIDGYVRTYEDFHIKSRYEEMMRLSSELIGDFKEVEDNFKDITRRIYEFQQQAGISKGRVIGETFDALEALQDTDQGRSFYAFWQFLRDRSSQDRFDQLVIGVNAVLEDREMNVPTRSLRRLKDLIYLAARKVQTKNHMLSDRLSKEVVTQDLLENRQTKELMSEIRQLAMKMVGRKPMRDSYLELHHMTDIYLPMERKLGEPARKQSHSVNAGNGQVSLNDLQDLGKIYKGEIVDKKVLRANVRQMLLSRDQVSLKEVVAENGITKGLAELLGYVSLVSDSEKFFFMDKTRETILFDPEQKKYLELPQLIFSR